jgi:hypothetical protein
LFLLHKLQPPNLGIITGVLMHLIRCIDSTPLIVPAHVRASLASLRIKEMQQTFGWMVLHNLQIPASGATDDDDLDVLEDVEQKDDRDVLRSLNMGLDFKEKKVWRGRPGDAPSVAYPLGSMPTWSELVKALRSSQPWIIMEDWTFDSTWTTSISASKLFVLFSRQIWLLLHPAWIAVQPTPPIKTLEEAMGSWSLSEICSKLTSAEFLPCNAQLRGARRGRPDKSFKDRFRTFFPENSAPQGSQWNLFWERPGYIGEYHHLRQTISDEDGRERLDDEIQHIFRHIQCLPNSHAHTSMFRGRVWSKRDDGIELVTNPLFYKIVEIGARPGPGLKKTRKPVVRGQKGFASDLLKLEGFDEEAARQAIAEERSRRRIINAKKSAKSKAKRKPPNKKTTSKPDDVDVSDEPSPRHVTKGKKAFTSDLWKSEGLNEQDVNIDVDEEDEEDGNIDEEDDEDEDDSSDPYDPDEEEEEWDD